MRGICALVAVTLAAGAGGQPVALEGDRWRLELSRDTGTFDLLVQPAGETEFVSIQRPGGEEPWYGYNDTQREVRTSSVQPVVERDGRAVTVRCVLDEDTGVSHEATYHALPEGVLVVSRFRIGSARVAPPVGSIVRHAPKLDVDIGLLTHYAFADDHGVRHQGAIEGLGERDAYAGVGGWGGRGDVAEALDPERPHLLLHGPDQGASVGVIPIMYRSSWEGSQSFLQLYHGGANFWYTGFLPRAPLAGERAFVLYAKQSATPDDIYRDAPRLCREAERMIERGEVHTVDLGRELEARQRFEAEWPAVYAEAAERPTTRSAWLAMETLRAAQQWADRAPDRAVDLLDRARALLATETAAPGTVTAPVECTDRP